MGHLEILTHPGKAINIAASSPTSAATANQHFSRLFLMGPDYFGIVSQSLEFPAGGRLVTPKNKRVPENFDLPSGAGA